MPESGSTSSSLRHEPTSPPAAPHSAIEAPGGAARRGRSASAGMRGSPSGLDALLRPARGAATTARRLARRRASAWSGGPGWRRPQHRPGVCRGGYGLRCHHRRRGSTGGGVGVGGGTGSTGTSSGSEGGGWASRRWSCSSGREAMISSQRGHWWGMVARVARRSAWASRRSGWQEPMTVTPPSYDASERRPSDQEMPHGRVRPSHPPTASPASAPSTGPTTPHASTPATNQYRTGRHDHGSARLRGLGGDRCTLRVPDRVL